MTEPSRFQVGQRVRINEEDDPPTHVGRMGIIEASPGREGARMASVRVDRTKELLWLPESYIEPVTTKPSSLLANDLLLPWEPGHPQRSLNAFLEDNRLTGQILETSLFYDRIVIPTVDFSIVVPLVHWLGQALFAQMLTSEVLCFVRIQGSIAYIGNGGGLSLYEIHPGVGKELSWWDQTAICSPAEAVSLHLTNRLDGLASSQISGLAQLVEVCTVDTAFPDFDSKVAHETYKDIQRSELLSALFSLRNRNLTQLAGIEANQMRSFLSITAPEVARDEIDITLKIAMLNLEAYLAEEVGARDMVTDRGFRRLLNAKAERYSGSVSKASFSEIITLERLPNVRSAIMAGIFPPRDAWEFRNTERGQEFRGWFDRVGPKDPTETAQRYVEALRDISPLHAGPTKMVRFLVLQAASGLAGLFGDPTAAVAMSTGIGAIDSFLLERIKLGYNPRYFIDELRHRLLPEK